MINFINKKLLSIITLMTLFTGLTLYSCSKSTYQEEKLVNIEEPSFEYSLEFNDIDVMDSDSLYYKLAFDMTGIDNLDMFIKIDDSLYDSIVITDIDSSIQILSGYIPLNSDGMDINVSFIHNDIILSNQDHTIPEVRDIQVLTFTNKGNNKYFNSLFKDSKIVNNKNITYDKFKKYDFANTEVIIIYDLDILSEKMIVQLQNFLLNEGSIFVLMNQNIIENNKLFYSLGYPKVKAIRGSSKNQFFSMIDQGFLKKYSFHSKDLINNSELYRYFELKDSQEEFSKIMISTNDPLLLEKEVLGGKIFFLTTKIDSDWSNNSFNLVLKDIFNRVLFQRLLTDES